MKGSYKNFENRTFPDKKKECTMSLAHGDVDLWSVARWDEDLPKETIKNGRHQEC